MIESCSQCHRRFGEKGPGFAPRSLNRPRLCFGCAREQQAQEAEAKLGEWTQGLPDIEAITARQARFGRDCRTAAIIKIRDYIRATPRPLAHQQAGAEICRRAVSRYRDARFWIDHRNEHPVRTRGGDPGYLVDDLADALASVCAEAD